MTSRSIASGIISGGRNSASRWRPRPGRWWPGSGHLALVPLILGTTGAASLESTVQLLAKDAAYSYLEPVSSAFGVNLNSGWFHNSPPGKKFRFSFEAGVVGMGTFLGDGPTHFETQGDFRFNKEQSEAIVEPAYDAFVNSLAGQLLGPQQRQALHDSMVAVLSGQDFTVGMSGATVTGKEDDSLRIAFTGDAIRLRVPQHDGLAPIDTTFDFPEQEFALPVGGLLSDLPVLPMGVPQLSLGSVYGTQLSFRWVPEIQMTEELGSFSYFGMGVQHNPAAWLPIKMPVDISGAFYFQKMDIGRFFSSTAWSLGMNAGKTFGWRFISATPYAGLMLESSNLAVEYEYTIELPDGPSTRKIDFDMPGSNRGRATLGLTLRLLTFSINADYSLGKYDAVSAGLMFAI